MAISKTTKPKTTKTSKTSSSSQSLSSAQRKQVKSQLDSIQSSINNIAASRGVKLVKNSRGGYDSVPTGGNQKIRDNTVYEGFDAENIGTGRAKLPQREVNDPGNLATSNNFGLANLMSSLGYSVDSNGQFVSSQNNNTTTSPTDGGTGGDGYQKNFEAYMQMSGANKPVDQGKIYSDLEKEAGLRQKQKLVSSYTSQLNSIVAKSQADSLAVTGQGRGIPEVIIGGQQAQINKEAAIQALPVQAQLSAAQGDLEMAQQHVDKMFNLRVTDAQNAYNYKAKVIDSLFEFANAQETRKLQAAKEAGASNMSLLQNAINFNQQIASQALQSGNTAAFRQLTQLVPPDPNSKTFAADLAAYNSKLAQYGATGGGTGDRVLTLDEAAKYGVPVGTKLSDLMGTIPGGGAANPDLAKENASDFQFAKLAHDNVKNIVKSATGKSDLSELTEADMAKFDDTQAEVISKALSITINPKATKAAGGEDALGPTGFWQKYVSDPIRQGLTGQRYSPKNLLNAIKTIDTNFQGIQKNYSAGGTTLPTTGGQGGTDQYAAYRAQVPAGEILIMRNGQIGTVPPGEFNPATDKKL